MSKKLIWELMGVILGTLLMALSYALFLIPNKLAAGGISGLGIILYHLYQFPVSLSVFVGNVPLFILA